MYSCKGCPSGAIGPGVIRTGFRSPDNPTSLAAEPDRDRSLSVRPPVPCRGAAYAYYIPFSTVISSYYISLGAYNEFPDDLKAVLDELQFSQEFLDINNSYVEAMMTDVETACTSGNENFQFLDLPADVADAMMSSCSAEIDSKVAELNEAGLDGDGALALLQSYAADAAE